MLSLSNLSISYPNQRVFKNLNLEINENEFLAVVGGNGCGKSTLAHYLSGVLPEFIPAKVQPKLTTNNTPALIMQNPSAQFFGLTIADELPQQIIQNHNLQHLANKSVYELSEGQKQKVNLLANLSHCPDFLLLDEPLELLDPYEAKTFGDSLSKISTTKVWFDKDARYTKSADRTHYLQKPCALKKIKKQNPALGRKILNAQFSFKINDFSLNDVSFSMREHEKIALIGKNGSGKTTLLKIFAGLLKAKGKLAAPKASYATQLASHQLFEDTVELEISQKKDIQKLNLQNLLKRDPKNLSKGQQKLVSIAALLPNTLQLIDEPTTWLDSANKTAVLNSFNSSNETMVIATHDPDIIEIVDRVFLVNEGGVQECSNTTVKRFFRAQQLA